MESMNMKRSTLTKKSDSSPVNMFQDKFRKSLVKQLSCKNVFYDINKVGEEDEKPKTEM